MLDGRARHASGVVVTNGGYGLRITLTQAAPDILTRLAMPFFQAIDTAIGIEPQGAKAPLPRPARTTSPRGRRTRASSSGGTRTTSGEQRFATRPANFDTFEFDANIGLDAQVLRIRAGQSDYGAEGVDPAAHADLARQFGINRRQYQVRQIPVTYFIAINTTRGLFRDPAVRKAVNLAIDRQAILAQRGYLAGKRADQILPPGIPGFRDFQALAAPLHRGQPDPRTAAHAGPDGDALMLAGNRGASLTIPQIVKFNLAKIGIDMDTRHLAAGPLSSTAGRRGEPFEFYLGGWHADYPDPNNFLDVLLEREQHPRGEQQQPAYFNVPADQPAARGGGAALGRDAVRRLRGARPRDHDEARAVGARSRTRTTATSSRPASGATSTTRPTPFNLVTACLTR